MDLRQYLSTTFYRNLLASLFGAPRARQAAIPAAGVLGAAVVGMGAFVLYNQVMAVPIPDVKKATPKEIVKFLGHPRGLARLPIEERLVVAGNLLQAHYEPAKRKELTSALRQMTTEEKKVCREAIFEVGYNILTKEAGEFLRTEPEDRAEFIDRKIADVYRARNYLAGNPRAGGQRPQLVDDSWLEGLPTDSDGMIKLMISRTKPRDRARMKPYVEGVRHRMEELKKDPRERERLKARYMEPASAEG